MTAPPARYDRIGRTYATTRAEEPRIAARIHGADLGYRLPIA